MLSLYWQLLSLQKWQKATEFNVKAANSTLSVASFCSCCLMLTVHTHQVSTATWRTRQRCDSQLLSPSLLPFAARHLPGRVIIGNNCLCSQCSRDVRTRTFSWTHTNAFKDTFASAHCYEYVCAFADTPANVDNADMSATARRRVASLYSAAHANTTLR